MMCLKSFGLSPCRDRSVPISCLNGGSLWQRIPYALGSLRGLPPHPGTQIRDCHSSGMAGSIRSVLDLHIKDTSIPFSRHFDALNKLCESIYDMPLSYRDAIVTYCRVQEVNIYIQQLFDNLQPQQIHLYPSSRNIDDQGRIISPSSILKLLELLEGRPVALSILGAIARQEGCDISGLSEVLARLEAGIAKELSASQQDNVDPVMDYTGLEVLKDRIIHSGIRMHTLRQTAVPLWGSWPGKHMFIYNMEN